MNEVGFLNGMELPEPKLPDVFDYDASVATMRDLRDKTGEGFKKLMQELWIARECLAVITGRPRKVQSKGPRARTWGEYLEAVGLARSTVHKWLTNFFPDKDRKISLPTKPAPKLPPKSSTSEPVTPPKAPTDPALGNAMAQPAWSATDVGELTDEQQKEMRAVSCTPTAELDSLVRDQAVRLRVKVQCYPDFEKRVAAIKLLSELFMLFSAQ